MNDRPDQLREEAPMNVRRRTSMIAAVPESHQGRPAQGGDLPGLVLGPRGHRGTTGPVTCPHPPAPTTTTTPETYRCTAVDTRYLTCVSVPD